MRVKTYCPECGKHYQELYNDEAGLAYSLSEASVTLNSPANNSISSTNEVTLNASAEVTNGAYLTNATLYDNSTGTWGARNTTNLSIVGVSNNSIFMDETNLEIFTDQTLTFNSKATGIITQIAFGTDAVTTSLANITIVQAGNTILQKQISTGGAQRYKYLSRRRSGP